MPPIRCRARDLGPTMLRARLAAERGFTLVELLIAMVLTSVGVGATLRVFGASDRTTLSSQRNEIAVHQAERELDRLSTLPYDQLGLTSLPAASTNQTDPGYRVSGSTFLVKTGLTESFVLSTDPGQAGASVDPAPQAFAVGIAGSTVTGKLYRYVTWRDVNCPTGVCDGTQNTKRVTVAVTIDQTAASPKLGPVWTTTIIPDRRALPPGTSAPTSGSSSGGENASAQDFYLYDTRCGYDARQAQSASHATRDTASYGSYSQSATNFSTCESSDTSRQPDLMGTVAPPGGSSTPLYTYSTDLAGDYDGGLALKRQGTTCPTNYQVANATNTSTANKWSLHSWSTSKLAQVFSLDGNVTVSLFTATVGAVSGSAKLCATLIDRAIYSGYPWDVPVGTTTYEVGSWPTSVRRLSFTFAVRDVDVQPGHRLVLVLGLRGESTTDVVFLYDHPLYRSLVEVATTTPL